MYLPPRHVLIGETGNRAFQIHDCHLCTPSLEVLQSAKSDPDVNSGRSEGKVGAYPPWLRAPGHLPSQKRATTPQAPPPPGRSFPKDAGHLGFPPLLQAKGC